MKIILFSLLLLLPTIGVAGDVSTFYLIRHTEKDLSVKSDPPLTETGHYRAQKWAEVFSMLSIDAIYSTDTIRTRDTAKPTAQAQRLELNLYSPKDFDYAAFIDEHKGQTVVVVGHSNTTPFFANGLLGSDKYKEMDESRYSRLYQVTISEKVAHSQMLIINPLSD